MMLGTTQKLPFSYQVFYIIKANRERILNHMFVWGMNAREAKTTCRDMVMEQTGHHAFSMLAIREDVSDEAAQQKIEDFYGPDFIRKQNKGGI